MRIRSRVGGMFFIFPMLLVCTFGAKFGNEVVAIFGLIGCIMTFFLANWFYEITFYDSHSTCALYAGKAALENGFDPKAQDGVVWNPDDYKVSEIYQMYPNNRTEKPLPGTAGFVFYTNKSGTFSRNMEFYDYRSGGDTYIHYKFYFDDAYDNDRVFPSSIKVDKEKPYKRFVPLEKYCG